MTARASQPPPRFSVGDRVALKPRRRLPRGHRRLFRFTGAVCDKTFTEGEWHYQLDDAVWRPESSLEAA